MKRKALAYVSDVILGGTGEVVSRQAQREAIDRYARENDIEVVAWFEDEAYVEEVMDRPGIRALLACGQECDCVLVERVWAFSRRWKNLNSFLVELSRRGRKVEAATLLWDCVSQLSRNFYHGGKKAPRGASVAGDLVEGRKVIRVRQPARPVFAALVRAHRGA